MQGAGTIEQGSQELIDECQPSEPTQSTAPDPFCTVLKSTTDDYQIYMQQVTALEGLLEMRISQANKAAASTEGGQHKAAWASFESSCKGIANKMSLFTEILAWEANPTIMTGLLAWKRESSRLSKTFVNGGSSATNDVWEKLQQPLMEIEEHIA
ncbi:MAG: hypothetical protein Q9224_006347, partial [Gallowayella concinna]